MESVPWPFVSVIIICEQWNPFLAEALPHYRKLDYPNFEVLVFSTEPIKRRFPKIRFISDKASRHLPAAKRDLALKYAKGEIFAFIDDDAYPRPLWLKAAVKHFKRSNVVAVGGPGINPPRASSLEKAAGWVSASPLGGWGQTYRFIPQRQRFVDDYPSMNFVVRAEAFRRVGGFDSAYYPGEDTKLCLDLTHKLGGKIIYEPQAMVYHHKRPLFQRYLIQNGRFGLHRGNFARTLPATSQRWFYFIPAFFAIGLMGGLLLWLLSGKQLLVTWLRFAYLAAISLYLLLLLANALWVQRRARSWAVALLTMPGTFLNHFWYGLQFIRGYFSRRLNDNYGRAE